MALFTTLQTLVPQARGFGWARHAAPYLQDVLFREGDVRRAVLALGAGASHRRDLGHGLVAIEQAYETAARGPQKFETHVRHIDIQMVVSGREWMDIGAIADFSVTEPYSEEKDVAFYKERAPAAQLLALPGWVAIFFPEDVHRSQISVNGPELTHKIVIKVPVLGGGDNQSLD